MGGNSSLKGKTTIFPQTMNLDVPQGNIMVPIQYLITSFIHISNFTNDTALFRVHEKHQTAQQNSQNHINDLRDQRNFCFICCFSKIFFSLSKYFVVPSKPKNILIKYFINLTAALEKQFSFWKINVNEHKCTHVNSTLRREILFSTTINNQVIRQL